MAIIGKGVKVYVSADAPIKLFDGGEPSNQRDLPNGEGNVKDYYGDLRQTQQDLIFQPASYLGTTTGETKVYQGTLYYKVLLQGIVDKRTSHGWGAGTYEKIDWLGWASSADITDNDSFALEKFNKRTDKASLSDVKNANSKGSTEVTTGSKLTGSTLLGDTKNNTIIYVLVAVAIAIGGFFLFRKK